MTVISRFKKYRSHRNYTKVCQDRPKAVGGGTLVTGRGTTGSTSPPALLGQGESSLQPSRAGEKNRKIGVELEKSPPGPPPAAGRGSRRRCRSRLDAAKGRHAAGRAPTRAGRDRAACCQQQAGPGPPRGPVWPSLSQLPAGEGRDEAEGTGRGPSGCSPWPQQEGARRHMVPGQLGRGAVRLLRNPRGRRWGGVLGRNGPDSARPAPASPAQSPLPGPRGRWRRGRAKLPSHPPVPSPRARRSPAPTLTRPRRDFCLFFFFLLMDTK